MTSFGWKRKRQLTGHTAALFSEEEKEGEEEREREEVVDWLSAAKRRRAILLEDSQTKSKRLQEEGATLAEEGRYWEAIKYWDEALQFTPGSAVLYEMKSQVFSELNELYPAVEAAEKAVSLAPTWHTAWQTLARAQTGLGEIEMALASAQKSLHLDPSNSEVREDIAWIQELLSQKSQLSKELLTKEEKSRTDILDKRAGLRVAKDPKSSNP